MVAPGDAGVEIVSSREVAIEYGYAGAGPRIGPYSGVSPVACCTNPRSSIVPAPSCMRQPHQLMAVRGLILMLRLES